MTIRLVGMGQPDVAASSIKSVSQSSECSSVLASFDLAGTSAGSRDVLIDSPDGSSILIDSGFEVVAGRDGLVSVEVVGPEVVRAGRPTVFTITAENTGNTNIRAPLLIVTLPGASTIDVSTLLPTDTQGVTWGSFAPDITVGLERMLLIQLADLPPSQPAFASMSVAAGVGLPSFAVGASAVSGSQADVARGELASAVSDAAFDEPTSQQALQQFGITRSELTLELRDLLEDVKGGLLDYAIVMILGGLGAIALVGLGLTVSAAMQVGLAVAGFGLFLTSAFTILGHWRDDAPSRRNLNVVQLGGWDPNELVGPTGAGVERYVSSTGRLAYAVLFENLESATAAVQEVTVTTQLDPTVIRMGTVFFGPVAFGGTVATPPFGLQKFSMDVDLRPEQDLIVRVTGELDSATGAAKWTLRALDPLTGEPPADPLVGFLPPNVSPPEGDGRVTFTAELQPNLPTGTEVAVNSSIVFDFNPPIATPTWSNTVDADLPGCAVDPLPPRHDPAVGFSVTVGGVDVGSGVAAFDLAVSENGGGLARRVNPSRDPTLSFTGATGVSYGFGCVAVDEAGNLGNIPLIEDTMTRVVPDSGVAGDLDGDSDIDFEDLAVLVAGFGTRNLGSGDPFSFAGGDTITENDGRALAQLCTRMRCVNESGDQSSDPIVLALIIVAVPSLSPAAPAFWVALVAIGIFGIRRLSLSARLER
jgi:hypothetical protein